MKLLPAFFLFTILFTAPEIKPYLIGIIITDMEASINWYTTIFDVELKEELSFLDWEMQVNLLQNQQLKFKIQNLFL